MSSHIGPNMIIGACEWVALPELGVDRLRARVDTGAKSCALHASNIRPFVRDGLNWVAFRVHLDHIAAVSDIDCECRLVGTRIVRSSSGKASERLTIRTPIVIGHSRWPVDITLSDRRKMRYRMLLGRVAMENHALVYPARTFLQGKPRFN